MSDAEPLKASCPGCRGTGDTGGNPSYGVCDDCSGSGWVLTPSRGIVDVPDIKLTIADFLENRDGDMGVISTDVERGRSAASLHDAIQSRAVDAAYEWRTIDSAPKDGRDILVTDGDACAVVCWMDDLSGTDAPSQWAIIHQLAIGAFEDATHWQPLPLPP